MPIGVWDGPRWFGLRQRTRLANGVQRRENVYEDPILQMSTGMATVPASDVQAAIEAAEECPGECIFLEVQD